MTKWDALLCELSENGFVVVRDLLSQEDLGEIIGAVQALKGIGSAGIRQPHAEIPAIAQLIESVAIRDLVGSVLGPNARMVRSILFDKTVESNWGVPWHQDLTIAVAERRDVPGLCGLVGEGRSPSRAGPA